MNCINRIAKGNPCPCGNYPDLNRCICTPSQVQSYLGKISQPLLDRIDLCIELERLKYDELCLGEQEENSAEIQKRVLRAREIQKERYKGLNIQTNSQLSAKDVGEYCILGNREEQMMRQAFDKLELSIRKYHKILTVARTIADLEEKEKIEMSHLREALSYRTVNVNHIGGERS